MPNDAASLVRLAAGIRKYDVSAFLVHAGSRTRDVPSVLRPGVQAFAVDALHKELP